MSSIQTVMIFDQYEAQCFQPYYDITSYNSSSDSNCYLGSYREGPIRFSDNKIVAVIQAYFLNIRYTELLQVIVGFAVGLIFGPFSFGLIYLLGFIILYEIIYYVVARNQCCWSFPGRVAVEFATILGWLVGRSLTNQPVK